MRVKKTFENREELDKFISSTTLKDATILGLEVSFVPEDGDEEIEGAEIVDTEVAVADRQSKSFDSRRELQSFLSQNTLVGSDVKGLTVSYDSIVGEEVEAVSEEVDLNTETEAPTSPEEGAEEEDTLPGEVETEEPTLPEEEVATEPVVGEEGEAPLEEEAKPETV